MADIWERCAGDLKDADRRLLEACGIEKCAKPTSDERVQKVLSYLESSNTIPANSMEELCKEACLSESRLSHLLNFLF